MNLHQDIPIEPGQPCQVDLMRPEDAEGVARLFQAVYGQGYPIRAYVEPERLREENAAGRIISSVVRTARGQIVGHNALYRSAPFTGLYEMGAGLIHPAYRGSRDLFVRLVSHSQEVAAVKFAVEAIFGEAVCNHLISQKLLSRLGYTVHALEVDLMPASAYEKEKSAPGRVATVLGFKTIMPRPHPVYIPSAFASPLHFIYRGLDDQREFLPSEAVPPPGTPRTRLDVEVFDFAQAARITVHEAGADLKEVIHQQEAQLTDKGVQVIQVWLDLSWPWIGWAVDGLRANGFFLGGLLPRWFDADGLLLQKILKRPAWESIKIQQGRSQHLLEKVRQDWEKTRGQYC